MDLVGLIIGRGFYGGLCTYPAGLFRALVEFVGSTQLVQ